MHRSCKSGQQSADIGWKSRCCAYKTKSSHLQRITTIAWWQGWRGSKTNWRCIALATPKQFCLGFSSSIDERDVNLINKRRAVDITYISPLVLPLYDVCSNGPWVIGDRTDHSSPAKGVFAFTLRTGRLGSPFPLHTECGLLQAIGSTSQLRRPFTNSVRSIKHHNADHNRGRNTPLSGWTVESPLPALVLFSILVSSKYWAPLPQHPWHSLTSRLASIS